MILGFCVQLPRGGDDSRHRVNNEAFLRDTSICHMAVRACIDPDTKLYERFCSLKEAAKVRSVSTDTFKPTLVPVNGGDFQNSGSRSLVFHHLGVKLCPLEHWGFIVHINHLH